MTPLVLVGHPNHACEFDARALEKLARERHLDGSVAAEVVLVRLENDIASVWEARRVRDGKRPLRLAMLRGYIACARAVSLLARREPRLPVTSWRGGRLRPALFGRPT